MLLGAIVLLANQVFAVPPTKLSTDLCSIQISALSSVNLDANNSKEIIDVMNQFHCGLEMQSTDMIYDTYYKGDDMLPYLLTNVPTNEFAEDVWPCYTKKSSDNEANIIPVGMPIHGLDNLKRYQDVVFKAVKFSQVTYEIIRLNVDTNTASAITYGTHHIYIYAENKEKFTQDTAMWLFKKDADGKWKITAVNFVDKVREQTTCSK